MKSCSRAAIASHSTSVMPGALISGARSYVATFWLGTRRRSSPGKGVSMPPLKKYVTCAYFSVSAVRNIVRPAPDTTSPTMRAIDCGGNATGTVVPLRRAIPAMVAVHPEVPAAHTPDRRAALREPHQLFEIAESRPRHRVAAVEHHLNRHSRYALAFGQLQQRE